MDLFSVDKYSDLTSPVHGLNPVVSLVSFLTFVVMVVLAPVGTFAPLLVALLTLSSVALVSRVPLRFLLGRTLVVIPFVFAIGALNLFGRGVELLVHHSVSSFLAPGPVTVHTFFNMVLKSFVCVLAVTLLVTTTGSVNLLGATRRMGVPESLTAGMCFLCRYMSVVADELFRMKRSRDSRNAGKPALVFELRSIGALVGVLFVRSYERAERVHAAMCSRGFDGVMVAPVEHGISKRDVLFPVFFLCPLLVSLFVGTLT